MDALDALHARRSINRLSEPAPSPDELRVMLEAAAAAPDHGSLRPWRFVVIEGGSRSAFGQVLAEATQRWAADLGEVADPRKVEKDRTKMDRAPMAVVVACRPVPSEKVPRREQVAAAVAATQNLCLAATALGYGSMWRTGPNAENPYVKAALGLDEGDEIVAFVYLGTIDEAAQKQPNQPSLEGLVRHWEPGDLSSSS